MDGEILVKGAGKSYQPVWLEEEKNSLLDYLVDSAIFLGIHEKL